MALYISTFFLWLLTSSALLPRVQCYPAIETCKGVLKDQPFCDESLPITTRVNDVINRMTIEEKISILDVLSRGGYPKRLDFESFQYPCEALHGLWLYVCNHDLIDKYFPTSFPQVINLGKTFDFENIRKVAQFISDEGRAFSNAGLMDICYWSPNINVFRDPRWGRGQEVCGEDPYIVSEYAAAYIHGLQFGEDERYLKTIAGAKHFQAYDLEKWGDVSRHTFNAIVSEQDLQETFNPPFRAAVERGKAMQVMCSYNSVNDVPACASDVLLQRTLREDMNFDGYVVSDCGAIKSIKDDHNYTKTYAEAVGVSINSGTDVNCGDIYLTYTKDALDQGLLTKEQLDESVRRVLKVRMRSGEFDSWENQYYKTIPLSVIGQKKHTNLSCLLARESMVLLKNDQDVLPLKAGEIKSIAVIGPHWNSSGSMQGDYSSHAPFYVTPLQGVLNFVEESKDAIDCAKTSDVSIVLVGLDVTVESEGKDREDLTFPGVQQEFIEEIVKNAQGDVILVVIHGGPIDLSWSKNSDRIKAIIDAGYPSMCGGDAISQVIFGSYNPSGRLVMTMYPQEYVENCDYKKMQMRPSKECAEGRTYKFFNGKAVYEFGHGLSYTTFKYDWLEPKSDSIVMKMDKLKSSPKLVVNVTNTGDRNGGDVVLAYIRNTFNSDAPIKQLFGAKRIFLEAGEMKTVTFDVTGEMFEYVDINGKRTIDEGVYGVFLHGGEKNERLIYLEK